MDKVEFNAVSPWLSPSLTWPSAATARRNPPCKHAAAAATYSVHARLAAIFSLSRVTERRSSNACTRGGW